MNGRYIMHDDKPAMTGTANEAITAPQPNTHMNSNTANKPASSPRGRIGALNRHIHTATSNQHRMRQTSQNKQQNKSLVFRQSSLAPQHTNINTRITITITIIDIPANHFGIGFLSKLRASVDVRAAANELRHNERGDNQQYHHAQRLHINRHNNQPRCLATYHELRDAIIDGVHLLGALQHAEETLRHERQPNHFAEPCMHHVWPERHFFSILFKPFVFFVKSKIDTKNITTLSYLCFA